MADEPKPTIDERIEALTRNLELMSLETEAMRERQQRLDQRERKAREALLAGIAAYLRALEGIDGEA